ncbi:sugar phosphate nucleotidyltransferase [Niallia sp. FSL W8-1348]|uniref:sugar phosphate nucleotidyltransferase n=1 Tax=Niallia sp. FSL W8-1348 TaxID=2954656 RepID=UPI0030F87B4F
MKLILLSGGSGKRLWPLSNDTRSKQFLKVLEGDNESKESMVQRVWRQLKTVNLANSSIVATSKLQQEMIYSQVGMDTPLVIEPERRDTFPAIALAASYLYTEEQVHKDEIIVVLPVDPFVDIEFFNKIKEIEKILNKQNADIALLGVKPTYPSSKYGYIVPKRDKNYEEYVEVDYFIEKPSETKANSLIKENALWNCGVFGFRLGYIIDILKDSGFTTDYNNLYSNYSTLPKISFDYEVLEKAKKVITLPYDGFWKDLGTWNTLTEEMVTNQIGKGLISEDSDNTHLVNELDIPITVVGLNNIVVAASPDGILVSDKESSPKIKELINGINQRPMYEERLWGWSRVLDYASYDNGQEMVTKRICINEGKNSSYHYHSLRDEVWTIVRGEGELAIDDTITRVKAGDTIHLPAGKKHGIKALTELEFIEIQTGVGISDQDFTRLYFKWSDVIKHFHKTKSKVFI